MLTIGYQNGSVVVIALEPKRQEVEHEQMDFTLCDHLTYTNLVILNLSLTLVQKTVINSLDYERNCIREESEWIIKEYKEEHNKEIATMKTTYETEIQSLRKTAKV